MSFPQLWQMFGWSPLLIALPLPEIHSLTMPWSCSNPGEYNSLLTFWQTSHSLFLNPWFLTRNEMVELLQNNPPPYWAPEKAMAPHSSTLAWKIPWMEEPGRLQSMGSLRVEHDWATSLSLFTFMHWRRKWQPTPVFLPGESRGRDACWAAVYGSHRVGHD